MIKLPIRYFTDFDEDTDKLEFPKHTPAFDLIHENGYGIRFSENGTHEPFITNIYKERIDKAIEYIENQLEGTKKNLEYYMEQYNVSEVAKYGRDYKLYVNILEILEGEDNE